MTELQHVPEAPTPKVAERHGLGWRHYRDPARLTFKGGALYCASMLQLSTRVRYGTRILTHLATEGRPMSREALAQAEGLTKPYVFKILKVLRSAGIVRSELGRNGGYFLAKPADTISVADIYEAMEGPVRLAPCNDDCELQSNCTAQGVWQEISTVLQNEMARHTVVGMSDRMTGERC